MSRAPARIVVATGNRGKLAEISTLLADLGVEIVGQDTLAVPPAAETAPTFVENALLKARQASRHTGLPAIADDSGLEVDALDGAPGIHSARYAGAGAGDEANVALLLERMKNVPAGSRGARFHCLAVYLRRADDPVPLVAHGAWEGSVTPAPRGSGGFGYDPVFHDPGHGCTAAELDAETKNRSSHRGRAMRALAEALRASLEG